MMDRTPRVVIWAVYLAALALALVAMAELFSCIGPGCIYRKDWLIDWFIVLAVILAAAAWSATPLVRAEDRSISLIQIVIRMGYAASLALALVGIKDFVLAGIECVDPSCIYRRDSAIDWVIELAVVLVPAAGLAITTWSAVPLLSAGSRSLHEVPVTPRFFIAYAWAAVLPSLCVGYVISALSNDISMLKQVRNEAFLVFPIIFVLPLPILLIIVLPLLLRFSDHRFTSSSGPWSWNPDKSALCFSFYGSIIGLTSVCVFYSGVYVLAYEHFRTSTQGYEVRGLGLFFHAALSVGAIIPTMIVGYLLGWMLFRLAPNLITLVDRPGRFLLFALALGIAIGFGAQTMVT